MILKKSVQKFKDLNFNRVLGAIMDLLFYVVLLLVGGCFAGFMAGLLGIGGGIVITPIQYYLLTSMGCGPKTSLTVTFATGLAVICVTMINSTRKHKENNLIVKQHLKPMMALGFVGAILAQSYLSTLMLRF